MTLTPKELAEYNIIRSTMVTQLGTNDIGGFELTINQLIKMNNLYKWVCAVMALIGVPLALAFIGFILIIMGAVGFWYFNNKNKTLKKYLSYASTDPFFSKVTA